jgi:mannose-1-phosphate guanylyltransferase
LAQAQAYLKGGHYFWNAGIFLWKTETFLREARRSQPELAQFIEAFPKGNFDAFLAKEFPKLPKISVDYAIMEKAERVAMAEARFDWDDVGSWTAIAKYLRHDTDENAANTERLTTQDAAGNIVYTTRPGMVALMGVRDLIVVQTEDALLVAHRSEAEKIKQLVAKVPPEWQ